MLEFDTPLRRRARSFAAPNSPAFNAPDWSAIAQDSDATSDDLELALMAMWLHVQSTTLRDHSARNPLPALSRKLGTTLAIAMLNRETSVVAEKFAKAQKAARASGALSVDHLANVGISRSDGYFETDAGSMTDAATDAADSWLYDIAGDISGGALRRRTAPTRRCLRTRPTQRLQRSSPSIPSDCSPISVPRNCRKSNQSYC